jgi:hypothetical protein
VSMSPKDERADGTKMKRGRPRKGQITQYAGGRLGRVSRDIDGESVRKRVKLDTLDDAVAKKKAGSARQKSRGARRDRRTRRDVSGGVRADHHQEVADAQARKGRPRALALHVWPLMGLNPMTAVTIDDIETVLDAARDKGLGWQSVKHIKDKINVVFEDVKRDKKPPYLLASNPVLGVTLPEFAVVTKKVTAVLRDAELLIYLGWVHPVERFREAVLQRQVMSVIGRCVGGERTGDMHANCWEDFRSRTARSHRAGRRARRPGCRNGWRSPLPFAPSCERTGLRRASRSPGHYSRCSGASARGVSGTEAATLEPSGSIYTGRSGSKFGGLCRVAMASPGGASRGWGGASSGR